MFGEWNAYQSANSMAQAKIGLTWIPAHKVRSFDLALNRNVTMWIQVKRPITMFFVPAILSECQPRPRVSLLRLAIQRMTLALDLAVEVDGDIKFTEALIGRKSPFVR